MGPPAGGISQNIIFKPCDRLDEYRCCCIQYLFSRHRRLRGARRSPVEYARVQGPGGALHGQPRLLAPPEGRHLGRPQQRQPGIAREYATEPGKFCDGEKCCTTAPHVNRHSEIFYAAFLPLRYYIHVMVYKGQPVRAYGFIAPLGPKV